MKKGLTLLELVASFIIILLLIAAILIFFQKLTIDAKRAALKIELKSLRLSLTLYQAVKGKSPQDLRELMVAKIRPQGSDEIIFGEQFLTTVGRDGEGYPLDPFGTKFFYHPGRGVIRSATKGYEDW